MNVAFVLARFVFLVLRSSVHQSNYVRFPHKFSYYLKINFLDFLRMLLLVMASYYILLAFIYFGSSWMTGRNLLRLEEGLSRIESYAKLAKLTSIATFFILFGLYLFGLARFGPVFEKYKLAIKRSYQFAAILVSFTILWSHAWVPARTHSPQL